MDSRTSRFIQIVKDSTGFDASFYFIGRSFPETISELRTVLFPELQGISDYSTARDKILQGPFGPQIAKISDSQQKELFVLFQ